MAPEDVVPAIPVEIPRLAHGMSAGTERGHVRPDQAEPRVEVEARRPHVQGRPFQRRVHGEGRQILPRDMRSAATPAAWGAAADVPKKFGKVSASNAMSEPKNVVFPPSGATTWAWPNDRESPDGGPAVSKKISVPIPPRRTLPSAAG